MYQAVLRRFGGFLLALLPLIGPLPVVAQDSPFGTGWVLQPEASAIRFQSAKNGTTVETSSFATFTGQISPEGEAEIRILMDSVDTTIDLRNVRMRFLFFETFLFPEAVINVTIDPATLANLPTNRRITLDLPYTLTLHGVTKDSTAQVSVTLISDDLVAIAASSPIVIQAADFNLSEGITKLQEAANVQIVPSGSVTFDLLFARSAGEAIETAPDTAPNTAPEAVEEPPASAALEVAGDFDTEACLGRFEILSAAGNIFFRSGSATLDAASNALLDNLFDIVQRCPDMVIEVGGHTDSDGSDAANLALSERRAAAVIDYLVAKGATPDRLVARGYGEAQPFLPNTSADNMRRNRRIEFSVIGG